jgi:cytochrome c553
MSMQNRTTMLVAWILPTICQLIAANSGEGSELPPQLGKVITTRCLECHDRETKKGGLDLEALASKGVLQ